jgi:CPA1 family monovalent cation:H+ antiporter
MEPGELVVLLFGIAVAVTIAARAARIPYTIALVVAGIVLGAAQVLVVPALTKELLFAVFLPGLLYEAAYHMDAESFWNDRSTIFSLAVPGVAVSVLLTTIALGPVLQMAGVTAPVGWKAALLFSALIAATDPISIVPIFRSLGAPARLALLIEGESLVNDGTAAVFFTIAVSMIVGAAPATASLVVDAIYAVGAGIIVGAIIGLTCTRFMRRLDDDMLAIALTTLAAYGAFIAGEKVQASGVIAAVTAGLLSGTQSARASLRPSTRRAVTLFWEYVAFALNAMVFLLIGFQVRPATLLAAWKPILATYLLVIVVRGAIVYGVAAFRPRSEALPASWSALLVWGGLRGALAMVLALSIPASVPGREFLVTLTYGVVALSILVQGLTITPLLRWLGLDDRDSRGQTGDDAHLPALSPPARSGEA